MRKNKNSTGVGRKLLSMLLAVVMICSLLPSLTLKAHAATAITNSITLANGGDYTLSTSLTGKVITVNSGVSATVTVTGTVTLNNQSSGGSPINIKSGGTLKLIVNGTLTVRGTNGGCPVGAYAGISVPSGASLVIGGSGTLNAYGGDAGDGASSAQANYTNGGGAGGYPAAGIGGGGAGGNASRRTDTRSSWTNGGGGAGAGIGGSGGHGGGSSYTLTEAGNGGTSAGHIAIVQTVTVRAYGGGGGSGGKGYNYRMGESIGGGAGAGGFSGGGGGATTSNDNNAVYGAPGAGGTNGGAGVSGSGTFYNGSAGGGYFAAGATGSGNYITIPGGTLGGGGGHYAVSGGDGGSGVNAPAGGAGGQVYVVSTASVTAQNGSYVTTSSNSYTNPTPIMGQLGYTRANINAKKTSITGRTDSTVASELASAGVSRTLSMTNKTGVGTGAGYTETSNGTYATANVPGTPSSVSAASNGKKGELSVSWTTPTNNNLAITKVEILNGTSTVLATYTGTSLTSDMKTQGQKPSVTLTGLSDGTTYSIRIRCTNDAGTGSLSTAVSALVCSKPNAPTGVTVAKNGKNGQLTVGWTTPANNGSAITKVEILNGSTVLKTISATTNQTEWTTKMTTKDQKPSTTLTGLTGGTTYNITVRVTNNAGNTTSSPAVSGIPAGPPVAPTGVSAEGTKTSGQIKVNWTTPSNNGADITSVDILNASTNAVLKNISATTDPNVWNSNFTTAGKSCSYVLTGLTNGTTYNIKVRANNSAGSGAQSSQVSAYPYTLPAAPTNVTVTAGTKSLTVSWTAPNNGGATITKYEVFELVNGVAGANPVATTTGATSATISGLKNAEGHSYAVRAVNAAGNGPLSSGALGTTHTVPTAPQSVNATAMGTTSAEVSWEAPENNGGTAITAYVVTSVPTAAGNSGATGTRASQTFLLSSLRWDANAQRYTATVSGLAKGASYTFTVRAVNAAVDDTNLGAESTSVSVHLKDQPGKITEVNAVRPMREGSTTIPASGRILVSWVAPDSGGGTITGYTVRVYEASGEGSGAEIGTEITSMITRVGATASSCTIGGLTNGKTYFFRVSATNEYGESVLSSDKLSAIPAYVPGQPSDVKATVEGLDKETDTLLVSWGYANPNGSDITAYKVRIYDSYGNLLTTGNPTTGDKYDTYTLSDNSTVTITYTDASEGNVRLGHSARITNLKSGTQYIIGVCASNTFGEDPDYGTGKSNAASTLSVPSIPRNLTVMPTGESGKFVTNWDEPERNGAAEITQYQIFIYKDTYVSETLQPDDLLKQYKAEQNAGIESGAADETVRVKTLTIADLKELFPDGDFTRWTTDTPVNTDDNHKWVVRVRAENKIGWGSWTNGVTVAPYGAPGAISDAQTQILEGAESIELTWTDPKNDPVTHARGDGGDEVTAYAIHLYQRVNGEWVDVTADMTAEGASMYAGKAEDAQKGALIRLRAGTPGTDVPAGTQVEQKLTIVGLERGETYRADIRAINQAGASMEEGHSDIVTMWTLPTAGAYTTVTPTNESGELRVNWYRSRNIGDSANNSENNHTDILSYNIYYRLAGGETFSGPIEVDCSETAPVNGVYSCVLENLSDGEEYEIYVTAVNGAGETPHRNGEVSLSKGTPRKPAGAPVIGILKSGNASAVLSNITAPSDNGGSEVSSYHIYAQEVNRFTGAPIGNPVLVRTVHKVDDIMTEITVPDLANGSRYSVTVRAVNGTDLDGAASNVADVLVGLPEAPTNLKVDPGTRFTAVAEFDAANGNGSGIQGYYAYVNGQAIIEEGSIDVVRLFPTVEGLRQSLSVQTDDGGNVVRIQVSAVNRVGESALTDPVTVMIGAPQTPELARVDVTAEGAALSWTESASNGVRMVGYNVYMRRGDSGAWTCVAKLMPQDSTVTLPMTKPASSDKLTADYQGLTAGTEYQVCVRAENLVGESQNSNVMSFRFGVPGAPEVQSVEFENAQLVVAFKAPTDTGLGNGSEPASLTKFTVYANGVEKLSFTPEQAKAATESNTAAYWYDAEADVYYARLSDLANGSTYRVQVTAWNQYGEGPMSPLGMDGTPATGADAPRNILAEAVSDKEIALSWRAPLYNGGDNISGYIVKVFDANTDNIITNATVEIIGLTARITGLTAATEYYFTVQAVNKAAPEGGKIGECEAVKTFGKPTAPQNVTFRSYKDSSTGKYNLDVSWDAPEDDGGTPITGYKVWIGASLRSGGLLKPDTNSFTITGLISTTYTLRVEAFNGVCNSSAGTYGGGTYYQTSVLVGKIAAPENLRAETTADTITLKWDPVEDDFAYYKVYELDIVMSERNCSLKEAMDYAESQWQGNVTGKTVDKGTEEAIYPLADMGTHFYAIKCFTNQGTGGYMSEVLEVALGGAVAPKIVSVTPGFETVDISFKALRTAEELNSNELYGYQIMVNGEPYGGTVTMDGRTLDYDSVQKVYNDTGFQTATGNITLNLPDLDGNKTYAITVRGVTRKVDPELEITTYLPGQYEDAQRVTVWTTPTAPVLLDTQGGDGEFTVRFRGANGMGLPIAGYAVFYENSEGELEVVKSVPMANLDSSNLAITVDGIENGYRDSDNKTGWKYYVAAYTERGSERWYSPAPAAAETPTVVTGIPGAPEITNMVAGNGTVTVYYTTPEMDPSIAVTSFIISWQTEGGTPQSATIAGNSYQIRDLTNGQIYTVTVRAVNVIGEGQPSEPETVRPGTPGAPEILDYAAGDQEISVRWKAPPANGPAIQSYRVFYEDTRDGSRYIENVDVNLASVNLTNLVNGVDYLIEIVAINANGQGQPSQVLRLMPGTLPGKPLEVEATVISGDQIRLSWLAPAEDGGLPIDQYRITYGLLTINVDASDEANYEIETDDDSGEEVCRYSAVVSGLKSGEKYQFGISAHNKRDYGEIAESDEVTTFKKPGLPQWKGISSVNLTFTAMWAAPIDNGGSEIGGYNVYLNGEKINEELLTLKNDGGLFIDERGVISYTSPEGAGLVLGAMYEVSIAAVNGVGEGEQTSTMYVIIQGQSAESVPGRTGTPVLTPGNRQLTVTWTAPSIEGVIEGVEGYYICYRESVAEGENDNPVKELWHNGKELTTVITGLRNGTDYDVWIVARNRIGRSAISAIRVGRPEQITAPPRPENIAYQNNAQMTTMTVTWDAVTASAQGGTVYYDVYVNNIGDKADYTTTGTSYQFAPESGLRYKIWVVARNLGGESEHLAEAPHLLARSWLNVETTGMIGAAPNLNLDRNFDGELDEDQIATKPTAPTDLNAQVKGLSEIELTWKTPVHENYDGTKGEPYTDIEFYNVFVNGVLYQRMESSSKNTISFKENVARSGDDTAGLKPGSIYSFQVSAINGEGEGPTSTPLQILVQDSLDPTNLRATLGEGDRKYSTVHLEWNKPNSASGRVPTYYVIQVNGEDKVHLPTEGNEDLTSFDWNGAVPNTNYVFRVWAQYGETGEAGMETSRTTNAVNLSTVLATPDVPTWLTAEMTGSGTIQLSWTAPEGEFTGYRLYVDNSPERELIPADATTYDFTTDEEADFTFSLTAVNAVTVNGETYSKESAHSNIAAASTREIRAGAPMAPQNLAVAGMDLTNHTITLSWSAVTQNTEGEDLALAENQTLVYKVFASRDDESLAEVQSEAEDFTVDEAGNVSYTYTDTVGRLNVDYVFRVCAVIVTEGASDDIQGEMSTPISATTKQNISLPAKPVNLRAAVSADKQTITLTWDPVADSTLTGYAVFLDASASPTATLMLGFSECDASAPSYTYTVTDSSKTAYYFQVAALNDSADSNSTGLVGTSELSDGRSVSLSGGDEPIITDLPAAADAPTIEKSVHNEIQKVIRVYWSAPTKDVEGKYLEASEIAGYKINIAPLNEDGTVGENFVLAEKFNDASAYDAEEGLWHYDIDLESEEYPISVGTKYSITITAWRSFMIDSENSSEVPGAGQTPWTVMQNLNLDEDDDWIVDRYPDSAGSGNEDVVTGVAVRVTATVTAEGDTKVDPTVTITDSTGEELEVDVTFNADTGALVVDFRVQPAESITYSIKITKPGCTYFELTGVPTQNVTSIDLNAKVKGGKITLYAGDANGDGRVNTTDKGFWAKYQGKSGGPEEGDFNGDGRVNTTDKGIWAKNQGKSATTIQWK